MLCALLDLVPLAQAPDQPLRLDLAAESARQIIVDRDPDVYLGHVSTVLLADGRTILCAYPEGHGKGPIVLKRSTDGGRTWSERLPTPASFSTSRETPTLFRVHDREGQPALLLWSGLYPARLARSEDEGATWSELTPAGTFGGIVVMGDLVPATPSAYIAWFHDDGRFLHADGKSTGSFTLLQTESADGGRTWSPPRALWSGRDLHLCEPGAVRSPDGTEWTLLLRENARKHVSHRMTSRDGCATWSEPEPLHPSLTGDRHVARYAPDGRLLVVFRDMNLAPGNPTKGDFVAWVGEYSNLAARAPGQYLVRLLDNQHEWDCGYAGLEVLQDGTFVATTYGHWEAGAKPYILSVRFTLAELDSRAATVRASSDGRR